jgi:hypothetical protein
VEFALDRLDALMKERQILMLEDGSAGAPRVGRDIHGGHYFARRVMCRHGECHQTVLELLVDERVTGGSHSGEDVAQLARVG